MRVDERLGDAEFRGNIVERGAGEAAFIEQLDRLFQNTLALVGQYFLAHRPLIHCPAGYVSLVARRWKEILPGEVEMAGLLDGKSALITGGGGGIGRATALAFAREGARVAVADAAEAAAQETVALINAGRRPGDDADRRRHRAPRRWRRSVKSVVAAYGRLDCAFNNAGIAGFQVDASGQEDRGVVGGGVRPDDRGQPEGRVALHEARAAADGGAGRRGDRQHRLDRRPDRPADLVRPMSPRSMAWWG